MSVRSGQRGFSLIELGIVLAVVAILATIVISSAGYFRAARERSAVDLVLTIRKAAQHFSMRHQKGLSYGVSNDPADTKNVTFKGLMGEGFLPPKATTPWGDPLIIVRAHTDGNACAGFTCIKIEMPVPAEECVGNPPYFVESLQSHALSVTCSGTTLSVVMR